MYFCDEEIDELRSWDEVAFHLTDGWMDVRDSGSGFTVARNDRAVIVYELATATAKQRRLLQRAGFRTWAPRYWSWTPPDPDPADLEPLPTGLTWPRLQASWTAMQMRAARDRSLAAMALQVLRDLLGCSPEDLTVVVSVEREDWYDEDDAGASRAPRLSSPLS